MPRRAQIDAARCSVSAEIKSLQGEAPSRVLKISGVESRSERRLILEGKLLAPWVTQLRTACEKATAE